MKYNYSNFKTFCIIGLLWSSCFTAHSQDILWEKSFGGKHADYLMDAIPTADYGFILAGSSLSNKTGNKTDDNLGDLDYWVWKMDEKGELEWQKSFGGSGADFLQSIKNTRDGGFILAGTSSSSNEETEKKVRNDKKEACRGNDDFWIIKLDAGGNEEWQKTIGGIGQEKLQSIFPTSDGGYILGGSSSSSAPYGEELGDKITNSFGNMDYWVVKLDKTGKIMWQKCFGGAYMDELRSIEQTNDNGYIVGGYSNSPKSGNKTDDNKGIGDYWVLKLDMAGEIEWQRTIGGNQDDQLYTVHQTYDGNFIIGGNSNSDSSGEKSAGNASGTDFWVLKLDDKGDTIWQETYDIGKVDVLTSIVENADHSILLGGFAQSEMEQTNQILKKKAPKEEKEINDYVAIKITENGEETWRKSVGSEGEDLLKKVIETRDGGYLLAGTSNPQSVSNYAKNKEGLVSNGNQNNQIQNASNEANKALNDAIKDKTDEVTNKINEAVGSEPDSGFKFGLNSPVGAINLPSAGNTGNSSNGLDSSGMNAKKLPASRDKKTNYGNTDFWVVKLKDKTKPKVIKVNIEAIPNPAITFTNVIIGYEFENGTATVVDMAGRILQQFSITSRTVPVDLSRYPNGVYVVNIKTNVQSDGVKVIKGGIN